MEIRYFCGHIMTSIKQFIKDWMLPVAITAGVLSYLSMYSVPWLSANVEPGFSLFAKNIQPVLVAVMLFLQFNTVSPHDLKPRKWHFLLLLFQVTMFILLALAAAVMPHQGPRILVECAMLCFVCPTAAAAGVITSKLGGSLSDTVTYVVLINIAAAFIIPIVIPIVHPSKEIAFWGSFFTICKRVFPLLVLPLLLAWLIRYTMRKLNRWLVRYTYMAFYIWSLTLALSIYLATRAMFESGISLWLAFLICLTSLFCCIIQFVAGRKSGKMSCKAGTDSQKTASSITAGQALGQKNTGFLIWLGYSYMTPVTAVAGGLYSVWQNIVNSWELYEQRHHR